MTLDERVETILSTIAVTADGKTLARTEDAAFARRLRG